MGKYQYMHFNNIWATQLGQLLYYEHIM